MPLLILLFLVVCNLGFSAAVSGIGGPLVSYHLSSLSSFDSEVQGNPVTVGGSGFGYIAKSIRIGGSGAGGFLFNPSDNIQFGLGYGGVVVDYIITPWLTTSVLIGGGGYSLVKIVSETDTTRVVKKISTGGFILFYPSVNADLKIHGWLKLKMSLGYFIPNVRKLDSFTFSASLMIGRS